MGMDVFGKNPQSKAGEYFRNNVWWWYPLADYVHEVAPEIAAQCELWYMNDGDGLNEEDALALADALQAELDSRRCEAYAKTRQAKLEAMPDEPCPVCKISAIISNPVTMATRKPSVTSARGKAKSGLPTPGIDFPRRTSTSSWTSFAIAEDFEIY